MAKKKSHAIFYHEFECKYCEGQMFVKVDDMHAELDDDWYPKFCCYCGAKDAMFIDWKHKVEPILSIDVAICGDIYHTEDIGEIDYSKGPDDYTVYTNGKKEV